MMPYVYRADTALARPVPKPADSGLLKVSGGHSIWWEETGPSDGVPVLVIHGGPGGYIKPYYRRLLDPARHRGLFFDQRGCGRSEPAGTFAGNTTADLISDIEALRVARGVERWIVMGGSWGSTLALAYAQAHPDRVAALLVSGVFLARQEDQDWWWRGVESVFPDVVEARDSLLSAEEKSDPRAAFLKRVLDPDPEIHRPAAAVLGAAEGQTLDLWPSAPPEDPELVTDAEVVSMRLFAHYDVNDYFLAENQLLRDAHRLAGVPGAIVAGRSDMCTPPKGAWDLSKAWPEGRLTIVAAAGHRWNDEILGRVVVNELARLTDHVLR